jgi:uncharacterized protein YceK
MGRKSAVALACLAVLAPGGCGTFVNLNSSGQGGPRTMAERRAPFGGVVNDADLAVACFGEGGPGMAAVGVYALAVDLPLSAVGDTLTWPVVLYLNAHEEEVDRFGGKTQAVAAEEERRKNEGADPTTWIGPQP